MRLPIISLVFLLAIVDDLKVVLYCLELVQ